MDVFENMSAMQMSDFSRAGSNKDRHKIQFIQTEVQGISISDILSHPKSFDIFMLHLSREFRFDLLCFLLFIAKSQKTLYIFIIND